MAHAARAAETIFWGYRDARIPICGCILVWCGDGGACAVHARAHLLGTSRERRTLGTSLRTYMEAHEGFGVIACMIRVCDEM